MDERGRLASSDPNNRSGGVTTGKILFTPVRLTKINNEIQDEKNMKLYMNI